MPPVMSTRASMTPDTAALACLNTTTPPAANPNPYRGDRNCAVRGRRLCCGVLVRENSGSLGACAMLPLAEVGCVPTRPPRCRPAVMLLLCFLQQSAQALDCRGILRAWLGFGCHGANAQRISYG